MVDVSSHIEHLDGALTLLAEKADRVGNDGGYNRASSNSLVCKNADGTNGLPQHPGRLDGLTSRATRLTGKATAAFDKLMDDVEAILDEFPAKPTRPRL